MNRLIAYPFLTVLFFSVSFFVVTTTSHAAETAVDCNNVSLTDFDYLSSLANDGDASAQYLMGTLTSRDQRSYGIPYGFFHTGKGSIPKDNKTAQDWWQKAAENNEPHAQQILGLIHREKKNDDEAFKWLSKSAHQGNKTGALFLSSMYQEGRGVTQSDEEAYFWAKIGGGQYKMDLSAKVLSVQQKEALDKRAERWSPEKLFPEDADIPMNIKGLVCGGTFKKCKAEDICGDLIAISCRNERRTIETYRKDNRRFKETDKYFIASLSKNKIVSSCPALISSCQNLLPEQWTCGSPKNMPLSRADQEKYPKFKNAVSCGDVIGAGYMHPYGRAPFMFYSKTTGEEIGTCGGSCENPPEEWTCGVPSNMFP